MTAETSLLIEVALEPEPGTPRENFELALAALLLRHADLCTTTDGESGMMMLRGPDEYRLEETVGELSDHCAFKIIAGAPQAIYRETLSRPVAVRYVHKQILGGHGEFALVSFVFEPLPESLDFAFENEIPPGCLPEALVVAAEEGIRTQMAAGPIAGFPLSGFKARLVHGAYHEMDSNPRVFDIAARAALREPSVRDAAVLLQPQMRLEIAVPEDIVGGVLGDLDARGATYGVRQEPDRMLIDAQAPLATIFFYRHALHAMSQGRAECRIAFDRYAPVEIDGDPPRFPSAAAMRVA